MDTRLIERIAREEIVREDYRAAVNAAKERIREGLERTLWARLLQRIKNHQKDNSAA